MKLVAPMADVQAWLTGLRERGYATVLEVDEAAKALRAKEIAKFQAGGELPPPRRDAGLIDPNKINVFLEGGSDA